jgi:citrate synthase
MPNQTDEQKQQIVMDFATNHQPKLFPALAATDHNVTYFTAILDANWQVEFSIEWLTHAVNHFKDKFQWLANTPPNAQPVLTKAQRRALVGLPEDSPYPENVYKRAQKEAEQKEKERREFEGKTENILEAKGKAEELATTASVGNHSDNAEFRKQLSETFAYRDAPRGKQVDWFLTYQLRLAAYKKRTGGW